MSRLLFPFLLSLELVAQTPSANFSSNFFSNGSLSIGNLLTLNGTFPIYEFPAGKSATQTMFRVLNSKQSITFSSLFYLAIVDQEQGSALSLSLGNSASSLLSVSMVYGLGAFVYSAPGCGVTTRVTNSSNVICATAAGESVVFSLGFTRMAVPSTGAVVSGKQGIAELLSIEVSATYSPGPTANNAALTAPVGYVLTLSTVGSVNTVIAYFSDLKAKAVACPQNCVTCTTGCSACASGFSLVQGACQCSTGSSQSVVFGDGALAWVQRTCGVILDTTTTTCFTGLSELLRDAYTTPRLTPAYSSNQVTLSFDHSNAASFVLLGTTCVSALNLANALSLLDPLGLADLLLTLTGPAAYTLGQSTVIPLPPAGYCGSFSYASMGLVVTDCPMSSLFALKRSTEYLVAREAKFTFFSFLNSTSGNVVRFTVPEFGENSVILQTGSEYVSARICLDSACTDPLSSRNITKGQLTWVQIIIDDPLFLVRQPQVAFTLYINGELRSSLINNVTRVTDNYVVHYVSISLNSADLTGNLTLGLFAGYLVEGTTYSQNVTWAVTLVDLSADLRWYQTYWFMLGLSLIVVVILCILFGLIGYCIAKSGHSRHEDEYEASQHSKGYKRRQFFEMSELKGPSGVQDPVLPLEGEQVDDETQSVMQQYFKRAPDRNRNQTRNNRQMMPEQTNYDESQYY